MTIAKRLIKENYLGRYAKYVYDVCLNFAAIKSKFKMPMVSILEMIIF